MKNEKKKEEERTELHIEMNTKFRVVETTRATDTEKTGFPFHYQMGAGIIFYTSAVSKST